MTKIDYAYIYRYFSFLLSKREYSAFDLKNKIIHKYHPQTPTPEDLLLIDQVLTNLQSINFQKDSRYALVFLKTHLHRKSLSLLKQQLLSIHRISHEDIEDAISSLSEEHEIPSSFDQLSLLWEKKFNSLPFDPKEKNKQLRFFVSRGFSSSDVFKLWSSKSQT